MTDSTLFSFNYRQQLSPLKKMRRKWMGKGKREYPISKLTENNKSSTGGWFFSKRKILSDWRKENRMPASCNSDFFSGKEQIDAVVFAPRYCYYYCQSFEKEGEKPVSGQLEWREILRSAPQKKVLWLFLLVSHFATFASLISLTVEDCWQRMPGNSFFWCFEFQEEMTWKNE